MTGSQHSRYGVEFTGSTSKTFPTMEKKCSDGLLLEQFYVIEYLKGFKIVLWSKKRAKLFHDDKLTVKGGRGFSSFLQ